MLVLASDQESQEYRIAAVSMPYSHLGAHVLQIYVNLVLVFPSQQSVKALS